MKEEIKKLVEAYKDDQEVLDLIALSANNIFDYVRRVSYMEVRIPILRATKEADDLRSAIMVLDSGRRIAHDSAISGICILNRLLEKNGCAILFEEVDDRHAVSDFCMQCILEFFTARHDVKDMSLEEIVK